MNSIYSIKWLIFLLLTLSFFIFYFFIGFLLPIMESYGKYNMVIISVPFLMILNYLILERYHYCLNHQSERSKNREKNETQTQKRLIYRINYLENEFPRIHFENKEFQYSARSILILSIGALLLPVIAFLLFDLRINQWLEEIVIKQAVFLIRFLFNIDAKVLYYSEWKEPWVLFISEDATLIRIGTICTAIEVYSIYGGIIFFTPHSRVDLIKKEIRWRKTKLFAVSVLFAYILNLFRICFIGVLLFYNVPYGICAPIIDISYAIIVIIFFTFLLYRWLPDFFLALYSIYIKYSKKFKNQNIKR